MKWAGGKRSILPEITKYLPKSFRAYWEPFVGGGAVFFALDSLIQEAHLSDINSDLIIAYGAIKNNPEELINALRSHAAKHDLQHYLNIRNKYYGEQDKILLAAQFIYLNKTCYNGLYRVNKQGKFNVPIGKYSNPTICDFDNLRAVEKILKRATLKSQSFDCIHPKAGDLVYCDPPYDGSFSGYTNIGFDANEQRRLRDVCMRWRDEGVYVIVSSSDTCFIRELYQDFSIHEVISQRTISCKTKTRGKISELLIVN